MGRSLWFALVLAASTLLAATAEAAMVAYADNRIAIDADGNFNDPDDWAATPMTLAILAKAGLQDKVVHYTYSNSLGVNANTPEMDAEMRGTTLRAMDRFGFNPAVFFDAQTQLEEGIENLRNEIDKSTPTDRLFVLAVGPMEYLWRALVRADPSRLPYVTVISHSTWNNTQVVAPEMVNDWLDIQALGVEWIQIVDQNKRLYTRVPGTGYERPSDWTPWRWLRDSPRWTMRWIYERMLAEEKADVSDAGTVWFLIKNDEFATPEKLRRFFGSWAGPR
ncbi:MAG: hypothetical protein U1E14_20675 [Geminicoccaceae bacterium]